MPFDVERMAAEQFGEHFAHHPGHVVTVAVQVLDGVQAANAGGALELVHALAHGIHAAADGGLLAQGQLAGHADDPRQIDDQLALGRQRPLRQALRELTAQFLGIRETGHGVGKPLHVQQGVGRGDLRLILDGVGDPAQQVGIGHRTAQVRRQLRNGQRKGARHGGQDMFLICLVGMARICGLNLSGHR